MGLVENALRKIQDVKNSGGTVLSLESLRLTSEDMQAIMPAILQISQLTELNLNGNTIQSLPDTIGNLTNLVSIDLEDNKIQTLPETLQNLTNLKNIYLRENDISTFPEVLVGLPSLEHVDLRTNFITDLPRHITDLGNLSVELSNNPLTADANAWIMTTFTSGEISTDNAANDEEQDIEEVLEAIYPDSSEQVFDTIETLTYGSFNTATERNKTATDVLTEFLSKTPVEGEIANKVYVPVMRQLLDTILDPNTPDEDKLTELQKMATSLGNCATPVKSFLIQNAVDQQIRGANALTPFMENLLAREAVEARIGTAMSDKLRPNEKIEQIQGLLNSVFLAESETTEKNKVKISGERPRLESKTENIDFAFEQITEKQARAFALLFCKTDNEKELITNTSGAYVLDPAKLTSVTSAYKAKLGLITPQEREVSQKTEDYKAEVTPLLNNEYLMDNTTEPDVSALLDIPAQQEELRVALFNAPEASREAMYQQYLENQKLKIQQAIEKYQPKKIGLSSMVSPVNEQHRRPPSPDDGGGKRKATPKPNEDSRQKRPRGPG